MLPEAELDRFAELIGARSGLRFPAARRADLERAVLQAHATTAAGDFDALYRLLADRERGEAPLRDLIAAVTIGETFFFRNQPQFEALERHILPELIERNRHRRQLRIWSAGCATGEEPYSVAIVLERLLPDLDDWDVLLLATDVNPQALERARRGVYGAWSFRQVAAERLRPHVVPHGREWAVSPRLRGRVTFARLNLIEDPYPAASTQTQALDLILCRNVLIYFGEATSRRVAGQFYEALSEGGWLLVGHAEPSQQVFRPFAVRNFPGTVVYQKAPGEAEPAAPALFPPTDFVVGEWDATSVEPPAGEDNPSVAIPPTAAPVTDKPTSDPYQAAKACADRMQWAEAEHWVRLALERAPLSAPAHYLHALVLQERGEREPALEALRRCVFADPSFVLGYAALADLYEQAGASARARKARDNVRRLLDDRPAGEVLPEGDGLTVGQLRERVNRP